MVAILRGSLGFIFSAQEYGNYVSSLGTFLAPGFEFFFWNFFVAGLPVIFMEMGHRRTGRNGNHNFGWGAAVALWGKIDPIFLGQAS